MPDPQMALVERLYDAFNRRDSEEIVAVCDEGLEFFPVVTAEAVGRDAPYVGPDGLRAYLADVAEVWEELRITPSELQRHGDMLLVRGRVYARSREQGIRDLPVAWIWQVGDGRFVRGEVFPDPEQAAVRFAASADPRRARADARRRIGLPDEGASRAARPALRRAARASRSTIRPR